MRYATRTPSQKKEVKYRNSRKYEQMFLCGENAIENTEE
jgi:hypothetical protein